MKNMKDWNKLSLDEHCRILEQEFKYSSMGIAKSVFELITFYKKHRQCTHVVDADDFLSGQPTPCKECGEHISKNDYLNDIT